MQKIVGIAPLVPVALTLVILGICLSPAQPLAQTTRSYHKFPHRGAAGKPLLAATDNSTTGVASFQGNFTVITAPSGEALVLTREPDCSLTLLTGSYTAGSTLTYTPTGLFEDYDKVLHTEAGLSPPAGNFATGCASPAQGLSTRPGTFVGKTTAGISVFVYAGYNFLTGANALYVLSGITSFTLNTFAFPKAGSVTTADLNGDGNNDLVLVTGPAYPTAAQVYVLLGNADGTFQTATSYTIPGGTSLSAVVDDFNGDGKLDIAAASDTGQISILSGKGDGTFNAPQTFTTPAPVYNGVTPTVSSTLTNIISADLRHSGKKDIIASNGLVLLGNGDGTFTPAANAAFPLLTSLTALGPNLAIGDLNKDGKVDLAVCTGSGIFTYLGGGDGSFTAGTSYATVNTDGFIAISDLDGDGNPDIFIGDANDGSFRSDGSDANLAYALMGNGDGTFSGAPLNSGSYNGTNLGDVNGDGQPDLILADNNRYTVALGTSKGSFNPGSAVPAPPATISAPNPVGGSPVTIVTGGVTTGNTYAVGDVNGDGKADLVYLIYNPTEINPATNQPQEYTGILYFVSLSNGDGTFQTPIPHLLPQIAPAGSYDQGLTADSLHIGDFNHDGKADLIFDFSDAIHSGNYLLGFIVLPGNGDGTFGAAIATYTYNSPAAFPSNSRNYIPLITATADLTGDNIPDLVTYSTSFAVTNGEGTITAINQVLVGNGDGTFQAPTTVFTSNRLGSLTVGDFNKDGKADLAALGEITDSEQGQLFLALSNGNGTFQPTTTLLLQGGDTVPDSGLTAADFDGDGNMDLAYLNAESLSGIFYGKGDGTFTSVSLGGAVSPKDLVNLFIGSSTGTIAIDLNHDGRPDILNGNAVLLNLYGSATVPPIVTQTNTATEIKTSAVSINQGASVTLTSTVTPASGSAIPTGDVTFADGETIFGTAPVDSTGKATFTTTSLAPGTRSITAAFAGSATFLGSISSVITVTVAPAATGIATTTSIAVSTASALAGTGVTFTAIVAAASGSAIPTGTVTFADSGTTIGTGTLDASGAATFSLSNLAVGAHSVTASYAGSTTPVAFGNSASSPASVSIIAAPIVATSTTLSLSAVNGTAVAGTSVTFTAVVAAVSGTTIPTGTGTVTFTDGGTAIGTGTLSAITGTLPTAAATFVTSTLVVGTHNVAASYSGSATLSSSATVAQPLVITAAPASDFSISLSPASANVARSSSVTSIITVTPTGLFKNAVQLTVAGNPAFTTVSIAAASLTSPDGTAAATTILTLQTSTTAAAQLRVTHPLELAAFGFPLGLMGGTALFGLGLRRRRSSLHVVALAGAVALLTVIGCGHSTSAPITTSSTPTPGTYTLTVTGTAMVGTGTLTHTATFAVTIQ